MAVIKHITIKNSNYDVAYDYQTTKHNEFTSKPILDENGKRIPRDRDDNELTPKQAQSLGMELAQKI